MKFAVRKRYARTDTLAHSAWLHICASGVRTTKVAHQKLDYLHYNPIERALYPAQQIGSIAVRLITMAVKD
jgi:hypothetical protein